MKHCPKCHGLYADEATECAHCGEKLKAYNLWEKKDLSANLLASKLKVLEWCPRCKEVCCGDVYSDFEVRSGYRCSREFCKVPLRLIIGPKQ